MTPSNYAEDSLGQQTTADYLEQQLGWESVYIWNIKGFRLGSIMGDNTARRLYE
ncbi:MAG: hypothetical protein ACYDC8_03150 [Gammaproteobacteria bacterium]